MQRGVQLRGPIRFVAAVADGRRKAGLGNGDLDAAGGDAGDDPFAVGVRRCSTRNTVVQLLHGDLCIRDDGAARVEDIASDLSGEEAYGMKRVSSGSSRDSVSVRPGSTATAFTVESE